MKYRLSKEGPCCAEQQLRVEYVASLSCARAVSDGKRGKGLHTRGGTAGVLSHVSLHPAAQTETRHDPLGPACLICGISFSYEHDAQALSWDTRNIYQELIASFKTRDESCRGRGRFLAPAKIYLNSPHQRTSSPPICTHSPPFQIPFTFPSLFPSPDGQQRGFRVAHGGRPNGLTKQRRTCSRSLRGRVGYCSHFSSFERSARSACTTGGCGSSAFCGILPSATHSDRSAPVRFPGSLATPRAW